MSWSKNVGFAGKTRAVNAHCGLLRSMDEGKLIPKRVVFPLLIVVSFSIGWNIPAFYDWTGSEQNRISPLVWQTGLLLIAGVTVGWAALPWIPVEHDVQPKSQTARLRFKISTLLGTTAAFAVVIAMLMKFPMVISGILCATAFGHAVWFARLHRQYRLQTAALFACMSLPYVWVVNYDELESILPAVLWMASGLPGLVPAGLIAVPTGNRLHDTQWLSVLLTGTELSIGIWMIRRGPRRSIAYFLFVLLLSVIGSFGFNAMVRA